MFVLHHFRSIPTPCGYLPDRMSSMEYIIAPILAPFEYEALLNDGCRKFGCSIFRPVCDTCTLCRPIRVPISEFKPSRSQRRALKLNEHLEVRFTKPTCDMGRLRLFQRYHASQEQSKKWYAHDETADEYHLNFVQNPIPSTEISVWEGNVLRGVLITENTPNVISAVYHYYDPDFRDRSLGTFLILSCIEYARTLGRPWVYLGYFIAGCASMEYKTRFRPHDIMAENGTWQRNV